MVRFECAVGKRVNGSVDMRLWVGGVEVDVELAGSTRVPAKRFGTSPVLRMPLISSRNASYTIWVSSNRKTVGSSFCPDES